MTATTDDPRARDRALRLLGGKITLPDHAGYDDARRAWNLAIDQRPAAVARPESAEDVAETVRLARTLGLRVAAQGTGHNAAPLGPLGDTVLVRTDRMRSLEIDPAARIARVGAGVRSLELVTAAASHGLAFLAGSSPDVGVVGYTLGGGLSWLGRSHGLAANRVVAAELVTADGRLVRADHAHEPELFWAIRGGGGAFGIVTALELELVPVSEVYAGILWWPLERGGEVLEAWAQLTRDDPPDELTTVGRYLRLPHLPAIPEPLRGGRFVVVEVIHAGDPAEADRRLAPLRSLAPLKDTVATITTTALSHLHMDPDQPAPGSGDGLLLAELPPDAVRELDRVAGAGSGSPLLSVEVRQLGGALARPAAAGGAASALDAAHALYAVGLAPTPEAKEAVERHVRAVLEAMRRWAAPRMYLNFADTRRDPATLWPEDVHRRLRALKEAVDPDGVIRSNHPV